LAQARAPRGQTRRSDVTPMRAVRTMAVASVWLLVTMASVGSLLAAHMPRSEGGVRRTRPVQWLHVHKSLGSTVCSVAQQMGERVVQPHVNCDSPELGDTYEQRFDEQRVSCAQRRRLFDRGGFTWSAVETQLEPGDFCKGDFIYATVLREPIERLESQVNYRVDEDHLAPPCRYDEIIDRIGSSRTSPRFDSECRLQAPAYDNYLVRLLAGKEAMDLPSGGVNASHAAKALAVLDQFDLVIPMGDISGDRALGDMAELFGWDVKPHHFRPHYSWTGDVEHAGGRHAVRFSEEEVRHLRRINRYDLALYGRAVERFNSKLRRRVPH